MCILRLPNYPPPTLFTWTQIHFWLPTLVKASLQGRLQSDEDGGEKDATGGAAAALAPAPAPLHAAASDASLALLARAALLSALPFCGAAVCMVANAWHARHADERRMHVALPMLAAALAWGVLPPAASVGPGPAIAALTVAASGIWATHGPLFRWGWLGRGAPPGGAGRSV